MKRQYNLFIKDMLECVERIEEFTGNMNFKEFLEDDKTKSAVVRKLEIIGEAAKNIPASIRQKHKNLPWSDMAKMRDKITHFYFGIDYEIVWEVIKTRLPEIKLIIQGISREMEE